MAKLRQSTARPRWTKWGWKKKERGEGAPAADPARCRSPFYAFFQLCGGPETVHFAPYISWRSGSEIGGLGSRSASGRAKPRSPCLAPGIGNPGGSDPPEFLAGSRAPKAAAQRARENGDRKCWGLSLPVLGSGGRAGLRKGERGSEVLGPEFAGTGERGARRVAQWYNYSYP